MTRRLLTLILFAFAHALSSGQTSFEGVIISHNTTVDEVGDFREFTQTIWVKGEMVKISISPYGSNPGTTAIYRRDRGLIWMMNDRARTFFAIRITSPVPGQSDVEPKLVRKVKRTGKARRLLGYLCDQFVVKQDGAVTEYWGTRKLAAVAAAMSSAFETGPTEAGRVAGDELIYLGYFPIKVQTRFEGRAIESSEVTKIDARVLDPLLFEIPEGYSKETMQ